MGVGRVTAAQIRSGSDTVITDEVTERTRVKGPNIVGEIKSPANT
jgi:hypothetical protein